MTRIKTSGFSSPSQLREYLAELEDDGQVEEMSYQEVGDDVDRRELGWLRKDVADLHSQLVSLRRQTGAVVAPAKGHVAWPQVAIVAAACFAFARLVYRVRHGGS